MENLRLIIDFGNTLTKLAIFDRQKMIEICTFEKLTLEDIKTITKKFHPKYAIISSVVRYPEEIKIFLKSNFIFFELDGNTPVPVKNLYKTPATLGKDRLAAASAVSRLYPKKNIMVIDAGTCITYDFINSQNEYLGGSISPGISLRFKSLHNFTDKLPFIKHKNCDILTGHDTETSILSGVLNGVLAEMDGIIDRYREKYPEILIVLSGGDINYFVKKLKNRIFAVSNITLIGLNEILDFNVENQ